MGLISKPIFSRLVQRFGIRQAASEQMESGQVLVPITNADELVRMLYVATQTTTSTSATHTFTVPNGKRWTFVCMTANRAQTGIPSFRIVVDGTVYILEQLATATDATFKNYPGLSLKAGDSFRLEHGAGTSGAINTYFVALEEDA